MSTESTDTRFVSLVDVDDVNAQNVQELASLWGRIENELQELDVDVRESYALLGSTDFLVVFEAPTTDEAFQAEVVLERHGLAVSSRGSWKTSEAAPPRPRLHGHLSTAAAPRPPLHGPPHLYRARRRETPTWTSRSSRGTSPSSPPTCS